MQVPAYVEYEKATSIEHTLALLARFGPEARILAGGHSLIPMMKLRLAQPETLIDINGLGELCYLKVAGGELRIGALTRHAQLLDAQVAGHHFAILLLCNRHHSRDTRTLQGATHAERHRSGKRYRLAQI